MNIDDIQAKYMQALSAVTADGGWVEWPAVRLALRLAVQDAAALALPATQPVGHVSNVTDHQRLFEYAQNQLNRLNDWLEEHEPGLYISPGDTADAILNALCIRDQRIADIGEDAASARQELAALLAERDSLRQQLAQMNADNADLLNKVHQAQVEIDRLTRQNVIATDTFNSLAHTNGVDPTPATQLEVSDWGRSHQAWAGLPKADLDVIDQLANGQIKFRSLSKTLRRDLVLQTIRHLASERNGTISGGDWDRYRPLWMPTTGAVMMLSADGRWPSLLAMALEPAKA